jgi:hypothetical protein
MIAQRKINFNIDISALVLVIIVAVFSSVFLAPSAKTSALDGNDFDPGRIIDDSVFYDKSSMSSSQIQSFLNAKMPNCDRNGTTSHWSGGTRAQYGASRGYPAPYTCLKDYSQSIPSVVNGGSDLCKGSISSGTKTAARIIYDVARACGINPQVLIVMLQKEQSLITDSWPWTIQYNTAMGYACPDSGPNNSANCSSQYFGFFNQVYNAAKAFRRYEANPNNYNYKANRNNSILYNPNTSCGSSNVFIQNQATASLYIYTPYQPNQAALNNLYGTGNSCSAYGNRNFWRLFNDWFGSTTGAVKITRSLYYSPAKPVAGSTVAASFIVKNTSDDTVTLDSIVVAARDNRGRNQDFPSAQNIVLDPGEEYEYYERQTLFTSGEHEFFIAAYRNGTGWTSSWPAKAKSSVRKNAEPVLKDPDVKISRSLYHSPVVSAVNQRKAVSFKVKNNEPYKVDVGRLIVSVRDSRNKIHDFSGVDLVLDPGEEYEYYESRVFDLEDEDFRMFIANFRPDRGWTSSWPKKASSSTSTSHDFFIRNSNIKLSRSLYLSPVNSSRGETKAASFIIRNDEIFPVTIRSMTVAVRDPSNNNLDFPSRKNITLQPGQKYTYYENRTLPNTGEYRAWVAFLTESGSWKKSWPTSSNSSIQNERTFNVLP